MDIKLQEAVDAHYKLVLNKLVPLAAALSNYTPTGDVRIQITELDANTANFNTRFAHTPTTPITVEELTNQMNFNRVLAVVINRYNKNR